MKELKTQFIVYTDGACSGNPGPGGWGVVVGCISPLSSSVIELGGRDGQTTNNRMELQATVSGVNFILAQKKSVELEGSSVIIYTDSVYVIKGITQWVFGWKKKGWKNSSGEDVVNQDIWENLDKIVYQLQTELGQKIKWAYTRGHQGTPGNERCDQIAVAYSKNEHCSLYTGSAKNYSFDIKQAPPTEPLPESQWSKPQDKAKTVWYVVLKNGVITRFKTWSECEASVKGAPGVKFKKVTNENEENELLKSWGKL